MNQHARLAPSSLHMVMACAAYLQMAEPYRDAPRTEEQLEGDAAHWLALQYALSPDYAANVGQMTPQNVPVTREMVLGAELWRAIMGINSVPEVTVAIKRVHATECSGTPDGWHYDPVTKTLTLGDYKFGHRYVDVFENWQLMPYAVGVIDLLGLNDLDVRVQFVVVQPRSYHRDGPVRKWLVQAASLRQYINLVHSRAITALAPNPVATPGNHCWDCPASHECVALQRASMAAADFSMVADRANLPPEAVGAELAIVRHAIALLESRDKGLSAQAEGLLRNGQRVPGWSMKPGQSRLKWKSDDDMTIVMGDVLGVDLRKPQEPITATQARDIKRIPAAIIDQLADRPPAAMKLEEDTTVEARKIFGVFST